MSPSRNIPVKEYLVKSVFGQHKNENKLKNKMNTVFQLKNHSISRTGLPPIRFKGEELVSVTSKNYNSNRWYVLTLYQTKGGKYVIERNYRTCWQGERDHDEAVSFNNAPEVIEWLKNEEGSWGSLSQELIEEAAKIILAFNKEWAVEVE